MYALLAHAVVVLHLAFVAFVVLGGLLVIRRPNWAWIHLPAALWGACVEFAGWICPLTPLENRFRTLAGLAEYQGDFVGRHVLPILYPEGLTRSVQVVLGACVIGVNLIVYGLALWRHRRNFVKQST